MYLFWARMTSFKLAYAIRFQFSTSNNEAEYEALITALKASEARSVSSMQLVVSQVNGDFEASEPRMIKYLATVKSLLQKFDSVIVLHVPREENQQADLLSRIASSDLHSLEAQVLLEVLEVPSSESQVVAALGHDQEVGGWMKPIQDYLETGALPVDPIEAKRISFRASRYTLIDGSLYKRSLSHPLQNCVD